MSKGKLYLVTTPIGNLKEFNFRSIEILKQVKYVYCEDTRTSKTLLSNYEITTPTRSLHMFNEQKRKDELLQLLGEGNDLALISDAGTPLISDPGSQIVSYLRQNQIEVISVGQNSAFLAALISSGINFTNFSFLGFAPREFSKLKTLIEMNLYTDVIIFYESPKRIHTFLDNLEKIIGDLEISISRELTKKFEQTYLDKISNLKLYEYKGEIVVVIPTIKYKETIEYKSILAKAKILVSKGVDKKTISKILQTNNIKQNKIYEDIKND